MRKEFNIEEKKSFNILKVPLLQTRNERREVGEEKGLVVAGSKPVLGVFVAD